MKTTEQLKHDYEKYRQMVWILAREMYDRFTKKLPAILEPVTGQDQSTIYRHAENPEKSGSPMPVPYLILYTNITGDLSLLKYVNQECGQICIPAPSKHSRYSKSITIDVCRAIKDTANMAQNALAAIEDKTISAIENKHVQKACDEAIAELMAVKAYFHNSVKG